jgi:hypothetical protein
MFELIGNFFTYIFYGSKEFFDNIYYRFFYKNNQMENSLMYDPDAELIDNYFIGSSIVIQPTPSIDDKSDIVVDVF